MVEPRIALAVAVIGTILGLGVYECRQQRVAVQESAAAAQVHQQATSHTAEGVKHDQAAADLQANFDKAQAEVSRLKAELAALRARPRPSAHPGVHVPAVDTSGDVGGDGGDTNGMGDGSLLEVIAKQDQVIAAQDVRFEALEGQAAETAAARDEYRAAAEASAAEADHLRKALQHTPVFRPLAVGLIKGSRGTIGIGAEYDISRLRLGVDLTSRPITGHSSPETEVLARVFWRF